MSFIYRIVFNKFLLKFIFRYLYRVEVSGLKHYKKAGKKILIVANHQSFLDGILLSLFLPDKLIFTINSFVLPQWCYGPMSAIAKLLPIDTKNPFAMKSLIAAISKGEKCAVFPEGRITVTGSLMKIYEGPGMVADKADAQILPIRIEGAQYSPFSRLQGKVRIRWFPKISLTILEPQKIKVPKNLYGRQRRKFIGEKLYHIMSDIMFYGSDYNKTLFQTLLEQVDIHGCKHVVLEDASRQKWHYGRLLTGIFILEDKLNRLVTPKARVGVMLPNVLGNVVTFFALQACRQVPAMINFSTGVINLVHTCQISGVKIIITSHKFIEMANLSKSIETIEKEKIQVIYLEDITAQINVFDKLCGYFKQLFVTKIEQNNPADTAVILFTSGSEGLPKAVALSHKNILANCLQVAARVDFGPQDIVFNSLPMFHSFGLTIGTLLPLFNGIKVFLYHNPLHYKVVPELVYQVDATIMFSTDSFLNAYARFAPSYNFYSIKYLFAGAEKLRDETRKIWLEKYGVRIFEGYGITETSPVLAVNTMMHNKPGTVGRLLPGIEYKIQKVSGINDGGKLIVKGPNIMQGYISKKNSNILDYLPNGFYDTGDIVSVDEEGFITIKGRVKRFAKIAGEMISLTFIEECLYSLWPDHHHAVISRSKKNRGEELILITDKADATQEELRNYAKSHGIPIIFIPKTIKVTKNIPLLATGKVNYLELQKSISSSFLC